MTKPKTLKEIFGDATRGDGRRFTCKHFGGGAWIEPIFRSKSQQGDYYVWLGIEDTGEYVTIKEMDSILWTEWTPPKKKVEKWLWAVPTPKGMHESLMYFYSEKDAHKDWIKIEGTRIEVESD